jgi:hypothetical protein
MEELINGLILAAERTAQQASGNDKDDWHNFARELNDLKEKLSVRPTPHGE